MSGGWRTETTRRTTLTYRYTLTVGAEATLIETGSDPRRHSCSVLCRWTTGRSSLSPSLFIGLEGLLNNNYARKSTMSQNEVGE